MALQPPKKNAVGFFLAITPSIASPRLQWDASGNWTVTPEWSAWATRQRSALLETLLSNPKWFSKPPRREVLDPLFNPWNGKSMQGAPLFLCPPPEPPEPDSAGSAVWQLQGLVMSSKAITPVWILDQVVKEERVEAISLFDDGMTVDGESENESDSREIQLEEVDESPEPAAPTRIRSREWEAKKFMAKERVREARLKAQIAVRMAETEEARFFRIFGDLDDAESNFSDYDLSPSSSEGEAE